MAARPQAQATVHIDNQRVTVTEWHFPPGGETAFHRHNLDYVVVPMTTGNLQIESSGETQVVVLTIGRPYFRPAGAEHNVVNANSVEFTFIEIEVKDRAR